MDKITSVHNDLIKKVEGLREARERRLTKMTLIDGAREIERALEAGVCFDKVFFLPERHRDLCQRLRAGHVMCIEVTEVLMRKIAYGQWHEGIVALVKTPVLRLEDLKLSEHPLIVVVESLEKPGNLGAILRTCDGAGVEAVLVCDPQTDIYNPNVIRASTGVVFTLPVVCANADEIAAFLKGKNINTCATEPLKGRLYTQVDFKGAWALVLGREDRGLSSFWLEAAHQTVKIPMQGRADSLNVSIAAAIILYEALRQRAVL